MGKARLNMNPAPLAVVTTSARVVWVLAADTRGIRVAEGSSSALWAAEATLRADSPRCASETRWSRRATSAPRTAIAATAAAARIATARRGLRLEEARLSGRVGAGRGSLASGGVVGLRAPVETIADSIESHRWSGAAPPTLPNMDATVRWAASSSRTSWAGRDVLGDLRGLVGFHRVEGVSAEELGDLLVVHCPLHADSIPDWPIAREVCSARP